MKKGFTLLEVILVVAVASIVAGLTIPFGIQFYRNQMLKSARSQIIDSMIRAKYLSITQKDDGQYGIKVIMENTDTATSTTYVIFKGATYASRESSLDEPYELYPGTGVILPDSATEILWSKRAGIANLTGTTTVMLDTFESRILLDSFGNAYAQ